MGKLLGFQPLKPQTGVEAWFETYDRLKVIWDRLQNTPPAKWPNDLTLTPEDVKAGNDGQA